MTLERGPNPVPDCHPPHPLLPPAPRNLLPASEPDALEWIASISLRRQRPQGAGWEVVPIGQTETVAHSSSPTFTRVISLASADANSSGARLIVKVFQAVEDGCLFDDMLIGYADFECSKLIAARDASGRSPAVTSKQLANASNQTLYRRLAESNAQVALSFVAGAQAVGSSGRAPSASTTAGAAAGASAQSFPGALAQTSLPPSGSGSVTGYDDDAGGAGDSASVRSPSPTPSSRQLLGSAHVLLQEADAHLQHLIRDPLGPSDFPPYTGASSFAAGQRRAAAHDGRSVSATGVVRPPVSFVVDVAGAGAAGGAGVKTASAPVGDAAPIPDGDDEDNSGAGASAGAGASSSAPVRRSHDSVQAWEVPLGAGGAQAASASGSGAHGGHGGHASGPPPQLLERIMQKGRTPAKEQQHRSLLASPGGGAGSGSAAGAGAASAKPRSRVQQRAFAPAGGAGASGPSGAVGGSVFASAPRPAPRSRLSAGGAEASAAGATSSSPHSSVSTSMQPLGAYDDADDRAAAAISDAAAASALLTSLSAASEDAAIAGLVMELSSHSEQTWKSRVTSLDRLGALARASPLSPQHLAQTLAPLAAPLAHQLSDPRSQVLRHACSALVTLGQVLGPVYADYFLEPTSAAALLTRSSKQVVADFGVQCVGALTKTVRAAPFLELLLNMLQTAQHLGELVPHHSRSFLMDPRLLISI